MEENKAQMGIAISEAYFWGMKAVVRPKSSTQRSSSAFQRYENQFATDMLGYLLISNEGSVCRQVR